ncbi:uncharacterized protein LOC131979272 [Centropristis striata]|uniref:uncharacterized protein LOC131979272 n=1 Tax=Centropristis striata TaxID=184440 RepID=UPI0027E14961|nr:uncharacterized protein LOC131979272 [Centropristis striata]
MEFSVINLSEQAFLSVNAPLLCFIFAANIFYACCLISDTERLKQPLKLILGSLVWFSVAYCVTLVLLCWLFKDVANYNVNIVSWGVVQYFVLSSMTSSVWLNFYYFLHIVPAQRALLVWLKRNIKSVTWTVLLFDSAFFLLCSAISTASGINNYSIYANGTWTDYWNDGLFNTEGVFIAISRVHILFGLFVMMVSSFSTAHYLHRHIKSVAQGGGFSSTPRIQSQIRVTVSGIVQGVLYLIYVTFYLLDSISLMGFLHFILSGWISSTVTSLFLMVTTVNLGVGQTVFRQKANQAFRALRTMCGVTDDVGKKQPTALSYRV